MNDYPISLKEYSELISLLYRSAVDDSCWQTFLEKLSLVSNSPRCQIFGFDGQQEQTFGFLCVGYEDAYIQSFLDYFHTQNFWSRGLLDAPDGFVSDLEFLVNAEDLSKSEYYNDWLLPQGDIIASAGAVLFNEDSRALYLGANYRAADKPDAKEKWLDLARILVPHMQQAFSLSAVLSFERLATKVPILDKNSMDDAACIVVDEHGSILFANGFARELLSAGHIITFSISDRLGFEQSTLHFAYLKMLQELATGAGPFGYHNSTYHHQRGAFLVNFARIEAGEFRIPQLFQYDRPCVFIAITRNRDNELLAQKLALGYGLTKTECEVASQFHQGLSIDEIAQLREKSPNTVRNQIKTIMQKLDVHGSVQLLLRLNQIA